MPHEWKLDMKKDSIIRNSIGSITQRKFPFMPNGNFQPFEIDGTETEMDERANIEMSICIKSRKAEQDI